MRQVLGRRMGRDLIELYIAEAEELLGELAAAIAHSDPAGAQRAAHSLKSSSDYIGAAAVARLSGELEALAQASILEPASQLTAELRSLLERTSEQLLDESRRREMTP